MYPGINLFALESGILASVEVWYSLELYLLVYPALVNLQHCRQFFNVHDCAVSPASSRNATTCHHATYCRRYPLNVLIIYLYNHGCDPLCLCCVVRATSCLACQPAAPAPCYQVAGEARRAQRGPGGSPCRGRCQVLGFITLLLSHHTRKIRRWF